MTEPVRTDIFFIDYRVLGTWNKTDIPGFYAQIRVRFVVPDWAKPQA